MQRIDIFWLIVGGALLFIARHFGWIKIRGPELLMIVAVIVLLFGARELPRIARMMGGDDDRFRGA